MRCKKVLALLDDHVDGLLPAPEAEAVRDHLDRCLDCRETSLALKAASASLSTWDDADAPAGCFDKILAKIEALPAGAYDRPAPRRARPMMPRFDEIDVARFRRVATGGLAAAAAVLGALVVTRQETRAVRRPRELATTNFIGATNFGGPVNSTPAWFQNSYFDNGLLYEQGGPATWPRAPRHDAFELSPR